MVSPLRDMRLQTLVLYRTDFGNSGMKYLSDMLRVLDISGTQVTDVGLRCLEKLQLRALLVSDNKMVGTGLQYLARMPLQLLDVSNTGLVDARNYPSHI